MNGQNNNSENITNKKELTPEQLSKVKAVLKIALLMKLERKGLLIPQKKTQP